MAYARYLSGLLYCVSTSLPMQRAKEAGGKRCFSSDTGGILHIQVLGNEPGAIIGHDSELSILELLYARAHGEPWAAQSLCLFPCCSDATT